MKKIGIAILALLTLAQMAFAAPKESKVKYGKNIFYSGAVEKNVPSGEGAIYLKVNKDSSPEIINGIFKDNIIDDGTVRATLSNGDVASFEGRFIFVAPMDKDATSFELIMERGEIKVAGSTYTVPTNISFVVGPDEFLGVALRSGDSFYTTVKKRGTSGLIYGLVRNPGSDFGAQLARVDSMHVNGSMYYPVDGDLWRTWINKTDYMDCQKSADNQFTPVSIHRVNPFDGGVVDSDTPGSIYEDQIYTGNIVYPDGTSYNGTFHYKTIVEVSYVDGTYKGSEYTDTWKEGLNLTEIERERLRKIERIRNEIASMVAQADTTSGTFVGRKYISIKDADQISYQGTPSWIFHLDYINFTSNSKGEVITDKVLIYAVNQETGGIGDVLYKQDASDGSGERVTYIDNIGKIYVWKGSVPENYESFYEILSGYDIALRSEQHNGVRYFLNNEENDTLAKEICKKIGVEYVSKAAADLETAESLGM